MSRLSCRFSSYVIGTTLASSSDSTGASFDDDEAFLAPAGLRPFDAPAALARAAGVWAALAGVAGSVLPLSILTPLPPPAPAAAPPAVKKVIKMLTFVSQIVINFFVYNTVTIILKYLKFCSINSYTIIYSDLG